MSGTQILSTYGGAKEVAGLPGGGFIVTWTGHDGNDDNQGGSSYDVFARRFSADGTPQQFSLSADVSGNTGDGALSVSQVFSGVDAHGARIDGEAGSDALYGGASDDILEGGTGADFLSGGGGDDTLTGGDDQDILIGGEGSDVLDGDGGSNDMAVFDGDFADYTVTVDAGALTVTHTAGGDVDTLYGVGYKFTQF